NIIPSLATEEPDSQQRIVLEIEWLPRQRCQTAAKPRVIQVRGLLLDQLRALVRTQALHRNTVVRQESCPQHWMTLHESIECLPQQVNLDGLPETDGIGDVVRRLWALNRLLQPDSALPQRQWERFRLACRRAQRLLRS